MYILAGFNWLVGEAQSGDHLFIHYAGHGSFITDEGGDESDGCDETICPVDYETAGLIIDDEISVIFRRIPEGCKMTCIFDSCHSGTIVDLRYNYVQSANQIVVKKEKQYKETAGDLVVFSGCKDNQTSSDSSETNSLTGSIQRQGAMTYAFIEALTSAKFELKYKTLLSRIRKNLHNKGYTQVPQMSSGKFLNIDEMFTF